MRRDPDVVGPLECVVWLARLEWGRLRMCVACRSEAGSVAFLPDAGPDGAPVGVHVRCVPLALRKGLLVGGERAPEVADAAPVAVPAVVSEERLSRRLTGEQEDWIWRRLAPWYDR